MTPVRRASIGLVLVLAVAGCGGGAGSPAGSGSATPAPRQTALATPSVTVAPSGPAVQSLLDRLRTSYGAPGGMALVRSGSESWWATSGTADRAGTAITQATRFRIASITKPIVATLVLLSVARGEVRLEDVAGDLLPGVLRAGAPSVTVRQLLNHTSGIFDESNDGDPVADIEKLTDPTLKAEAADLQKRYAAGERVIGSDRLLVALSELHDRYNAPGAGYHYSNTNYQLLAMILEKVTHSKLSSLLDTRIVEPLGLKHTTIAPPDTASPEFRGYGTATTDGSLVDVTDDLLAFGNGGNGGIISTSDELLTIMQAIVSGRLLPAALVSDMKTPAFEGYGLGLGTYSLTCGTFYGHEGGVNGTASIAIVSNDGAKGVVVALNLRSAADPHLPAVADAMLCSV